MKKNALTIKTTIIATLVILLCTPTLQAKVVSESQAAIIAERLMPIKGKKLLRKHPAKAGTPDETPLPYYIFTGNDGRGFVIISADDIARPVLGYSADAELTPDGELPIPMEQWLASIGNQIQQAQENGIQQSADVAKQWQATSMGNTIVKLETAEWGQSTPFNDQCPYDEDKRSYTGCVPTAYAILMKYYNYPQCGNGETHAYVTETKSIGVDARSLDHNYDWDNMPMKYTSEEYSPDQAYNVATLMADIGAALQANYTSDGTGAGEGRGELFTNFDYYPGTNKLKDLYTADEWDEMMREELDKNRPIIYSAFATDGGGHCFLLDGYTDDGYFSVNWGWTGKYNGFFTLDALTPGNSFFKNEHVAFLNTVPMPSSDAEFEIQKNGQPYPTLTAAFRDSSPDETITTIDLLTDVQAKTLKVMEGRTITLNIGDHSIDMLSSFYNYGNLTINGTKDSHLTTHGNNSVFNNYDKMTITGGTYKNNCSAVDSIDYRRCVWTAAGSETHICDVTFEAPGQVVCTNGNMTIESGLFTCTGNNVVIRNTNTSNWLTIRGGTFIASGNDGVIYNYSTIGTLTISGGTFLNKCGEISGTDYRRCLWTTGGSETHISNVTFEAPGQVVCTNGNMTIESGLFTCTGNNVVIRNTNTSNWLTIRGGTFIASGNDGVIYNYSTIGTLTISGGTFLNKCGEISGTDYRRCLWTAEGSETNISNVTFSAPGQVICTNGNMTIESGLFTCTGNTSVVRNTKTSTETTISGGTFIATGNAAAISNYSSIGTMTISGGTFLNNCAEVSDTDYRRCLWTTQDSKNYIGKASFNNMYGSQTLCFNGEAIINGADIINENEGYGCLAFSSSKVVIDDCKLRAPYLFYTDDDSQIICRGGLYSKEVDTEFLAEGCKCVPNMEKKTHMIYPFMVVEDATGIETPMQEETPYDMHIYNTQGILQPSLQKGVNIIRRSDGTTSKTLNK